MIKKIKALKQDYEESKGPGEDFLEWFLKRKARARVKFAFAYSLWAIWILVWFQPQFFLFFLEAVLVVYLVYALYRLMKLIFIKGRKKR